MRSLAFTALLALGIAAGQTPARPLVQAHRGFSERYPENTLLAFEKAYEVGADRIETDLALSEDGVVVLMHDRTVDRTTDGSGPVQLMTLDELRTLDAGSWKGAEFAGEKIPTLAEALDLARSYDGSLNLEIKTSGRPSYLVRRIVEAAVEAVREADAADRVMFSSFDLEALAMVRAIDPTLRLGLIDWDEPGRFDNLDLAISEGLYAWSPKAEYASEERVRRAAEAGLHVYMGSSLGPKLLERLSWGASGVTGNDTAAIVAYLQSQGLH